MLDVHPQAAVHPLLLVYFHLYCRTSCHRAIFYQFYLSPVCSHPISPFRARSPGRSLPARRPQLSLQSSFPAIIVTSLTFGTFLRAALFAGSFVFDLQPSELIRSYLGPFSVILAFFPGHYNSVSSYISAVRCISSHIRDARQSF